MNRTWHALILMALALAGCHWNRPSEKPQEYQTLLDDPRVAEVVRVVVQPRADTPGIVRVEAEVRARNGLSVQIGVSLDAA